MDSDQQLAVTPQPTVEDIETLWWEPLGCKCEVEFDQE